MRAKISHITTIFCYMLVTVWLTYTMYPLIYAATVLEIKRDQRSIIETNNKKIFSILHLTRGQFNQLFNSSENELMLNGAIYDVVDFRAIDEEVYCTVLYDEIETIANNVLFSDLEHGITSSIVKHIGYWWPITVHNPIVIPNPFSVKEKSEKLRLCTFMLLKGHRYSITEPPDFC